MPLGVTVLFLREPVREAPVWCTPDVSGCAPKRGARSARQTLDGAACMSAQVSETPVVSVSDIVARCRVALGLLVKAQSQQTWLAVCVLSCVAAVALVVYTRRSALRLWSQHVSSSAHGSESGDDEDVVAYEGDHDDQCDGHRGFDDEDEDDEIVAVEGVPASRLRRRRLQ